MLIHDKQMIKVSKVLCAFMHVERKHSSVSVFELHSSKMSLLVNGASTSQDGMGRTFNWLKKLCVYCCSVHTEPPEWYKHLGAWLFKILCVNRAKILISPVWIKCLVKFFSWLKFIRSPVKVALEWPSYDVTLDKVISPEFSWKMLKYTCYRECSASQH